MDVEVFGKFDFFTGVPDSLLKPLCDWLQVSFGNDTTKHITAANEGNAVALAAGYHLATGKVPVVYMQNSGIGNALNPIASMTSERVYGIPILFVVGWRGEPDTKDEPQHVFQGELTIGQLENVGVQTYVLDEKITQDDFEQKLKTFEETFKQGKSVAVIVKKGALKFNKKNNAKPQIDATMLREDVLKQIVNIAGDDIIIATTGKTARELFEIRVQNGQRHENDFLTVGAMGHSSSIALGVALHNPNKRVWVIDGDGAALMHMGAMATIGNIKPKNLVHVLINNAAHESVGDMPTVAGGIDFDQVAKALGYKNSKSLSSNTELESALNAIKTTNELQFLEIKSATGSRANLGRPTTTPQENKASFISFMSANVNL